MTKMKMLASAGVIAAAIAATPVMAAPTFYIGDAGRTAFTAATAGGSIATEGFEGLTTRTSNGIGYAPEGATFSRGGLSITGSFGGMSVLDTTYLNGGNQVANRFGAAAGAVFDTNYGDLIFNFGTPVNAFGLDLATIARGFVGASNGAFTVSVNGVSSTYNYSGSNGFGFLGLTSDVAFNTLSIATSKTFDTELNDVRFGTLAAPAPAVPEPATWLTMILGMGAVGFAMRRRQKISTSVKFA